MGEMHIKQKIKNNSKLKIIFILSCIVVSITVSILSYLKREIAKDIVINELQVNQIELGSELTYKDIINVKNASIIDGTTKVKFNSLGEKIVDIQYSKYIFTYTHKTVFEVVDTRPPVITFMKLDELFVDSYDDEDAYGYSIKQFYEVHDEDQTTIDTQGEIHGHVEGYYPITITATDSSGNTTTKSATVHIKAAELYNGYTLTERRKSCSKDWGNSWVDKIERNYGCSLIGMKAH